MSSPREFIWKCEEGGPRIRSFVYPPTFQKESQAYFFHRENKVFESVAVSMTLSKYFVIVLRGRALPSEHWNSRQVLARPNYIYFFLSKILNHKQTESKNANDSHSFLGNHFFLLM